VAHPLPVDYSIVIPAYNEADWLPAAIGALRQAMQGQALQGEIIVCNNNSSDATGEVAASLDARVVFEAYNQISRARNRAAREARGRYLVFVDADTLVSASLLDEALRRLQSGDYIGGGALVSFDTRLSRIGALGSKLWNLLSVKAGLAAGSFIFCQRDAFEQLGGFSEAVYASEEIWLSRGLARLGKTRGQTFQVIADQAVLSSGRKMQWYSTPRQLLLLLMLAVFPFMVRFRSLCGFWYRRPG